MKQPQLTPLLLSATLFLSAVGVANAQEGTSAPAPRPPRQARHEELIKRFDKNGDGKLDETERANVREAMQVMRQDRMTGRHGPGKGPGAAPGAKGMRDPAFRRGYMLGKFDLNNDGQLDDSEKAAVRAAAEQKIRNQIEKQIQRMKAVDLDNDGKLSDAEWAAVREKIQKERGARNETGQPEEELDVFPPPMGPGPGGEE